MTLRLQADVFPATARTNTGEETFDKVRVAVANDRVYVFADSPRGPEIVYSAPTQSYAPPPRPVRTYPPVRQSQRPPAVHTTDTLTFQRTSGCGCGSRLKTFNVIRAISETSSTAVASSKDS